MPAPQVTVASHFAKRPPEVRALYDGVLAVTRKWGVVLEAPNTGSIHLVRETVFAGVATRKDGILLSFKSTTDLDSPRIVKRERPSANRWYLSVKLATPKDVDRELLGWLETSWDMSG